LSKIVDFAGRAFCVTCRRKVSPVLSCWCQCRCVSCGL